MALFNSQTILQSVNLSTDYGEPFDEERPLKPVPQDCKTTGEKVKEIILNWKGVFLHIVECLRASEEGDGAY